MPGLGIKATNSLDEADAGRHRPGLEAVGRDSVGRRARAWVWAGGKGRLGGILGSPHLATVSALVLV